MLEYISFENYKSFEKEQLELKPITIILGSNSSGKSSINQLLLLLKQSIEFDSESFTSALKLNGKYINFEEAQNLIRDQNVKNNLSICLKIVTENIRLSRVSRATDELKYTLNRIRYDLDLYLSKLEPEKLQKLVKLGESSYVEDVKRFEKLFERFIEYKKVIIKNFDYLKGLKSRKLNFADIKAVNKFFQNIDAIKSILLLSYKISSLKINKLEIQYNFKYQESKGIFFIKDLNIYDDQKNLLLGFNMKLSQGERISNNYEIQSDVIEIQKYSRLFANSVNCSLQLSKIKSLRMNIPKVKRAIDFSLYSRTLVKDINILGITEEVFSSFGNILLEQVSKSFAPNLINYVSPLRAFPRRYYFIDQINSNANINNIDGDSLSDILMKNGKIVQQVNQWLEKFNFKVNVEKLTGLIHKLKINQNDLELDITDVGFGLSQILPILVQGYLSVNNSITIIEQPEIHLHPKMQASLAELFIDIIKNSLNKKLIIETHSEYLVRRLKLKLLEKEISPSMVGIYFIHNKNKKQKKRIEDINISDTGDFKFPEDFLVDDLNDQLKIMQQLVKNG
jgi:predicted ATPase